jgi:PPIC-type PPIASE domain
VAGTSHLVQRASSIALSLAAVALSCLLAFRAAPSLASSAPPAASAPDSGILDSGAAPTADSTLDADAASFFALHEPTPVEPVELPEVPEGGVHLADGTPVAPLGRGAPRHVRFGVVLVTYEGAEGAPEKGARHKSDALSLATRLGDEARQDFHATVQRGDSGSTDDVGEVERGVLEPAPEAVLFALPVGGVSGVIDTPKGFWIVKRLE